MRFIFEVRLTAIFGLVTLAAIMPALAQVVEDKKMLTPEGAKKVIAAAKAEA